MHGADRAVRVRLLRADGTPAAGVLVSLAEAPGPMPDLGMVADADGWVVLPTPAPPGHYALSVWLDGSAHTVHCDLASGAAPGPLQLPV